MKRIRLHGDLKAFKEDWLLDVATPAEAFRAINANRPGFLDAADRGEYVAILIDTQHPDLIRQVILDNANSPWADEELHVLPRASGDVQAAAVAAVVAEIGITSAIAIEAITAIINIALTMAFSALANLITGNGSKSRPQSKAHEPSYIIDGTVNVTAAGTAYPIPVGEFLCGSIVLSSQIYVTDIPV